MEVDKTISLTINKKEYEVNVATSSTSLLAFIRDQALLKGTKGCCYEGGCGVCTVVISAFDHETECVKTFSAPSCQVPLYACAGSAVQTIEFLGNKKIGYDSLQKALVGFGGTQCGYCSPAMIMSIHGQMLKNEAPTTDQLHGSLDGNLCRCTGYRAILDAFKSVAADAPADLKKKLIDIEDLYEVKCLRAISKSQGPRSEIFDCTNFVQRPNVSIAGKFNDQRKFYRPVKLQEALAILDKTCKTEKVKIAAGNTTEGVFKNDGPYDIIISATGIPELHNVDIGKPCYIGASVSIARCIEVFDILAKENSDYRHLEVISQHWKRVANTGVRNLASWGGNIMTKYHYPDFASDIFLTLVAVEAKLKVANLTTEEEVTLEEFLQKDMSKSLIIGMTLPPMDNVVVRTFKIMSRAINTKAYVNAAFRFRMDPGCIVASKPDILFGGIRPHFVRATETENLLSGVNLKNTGQVLSILNHLSTELKPDAELLDASPEYRLSLAVSLLYKTIIGILEDSCTSSVRSGCLDLKRNTSSSQQSWDTNEDSWPVGKAIPKAEGQVQVSGEAEFVNDIPLIPGELHGVFVQSRYAKAKIESMDAGNCATVAGFVDFVTADDIPGLNSFLLESQGLSSKWDVTDRQPITAILDPVFASKEVIYAGQSIGLVLAETKEAALKASKLVQVIYTDIQKPALNIQDSIEQDRCSASYNMSNISKDGALVGNPKGVIASAKHIVQGEMNQGTQFHFPMEPHCARAVPTEEGLDISCTTQYATEAQRTIAANLGLPSNRINISVRRLGGGFGSKITRNHLVSSAAAIAAYKLQKPVRVNLDLCSHMSLVGWRDPYLTKYKVAFDETGVLEAVDVDLICDPGHCDNESSSGFAHNCIQNVYHCPNWHVRNYDALTDTAANTYCRAPGTADALATMETIIEHIADYLKKDPMDIRKINCFTKEKPRTLFFSNSRDNLVKKNIFPLIEKKADVVQRKEFVRRFNENNRWKKRGLSVLPMQYTLLYIPHVRHNTQLVIYESDGSVAITHGGIEMGQGINTKIIQVAAGALGIPIHFIRVKPTNTFTGANSGPTEASITSDINAYGIIQCCEAVKKRMGSVAEKMMAENNGEYPEWLPLVKKCKELGVDLCERFMTSHGEETHPKGYDVFAAACIEVELDVLTGQHLILRADIIEDCGRSLSPLVDVGQVEGAFVMGLGFYTTESLKYDPETGQKLSIGTMNYKTPTVMDVPVDFRVSFLPGAANPYGVLRSKETGEPALCLGFGIITALRNAIKSARNDAGHHGWFQIDTPLTPERVHQLCMVDHRKFVF